MAFTSTETAASERHRARRGDRMTPPTVGPWELDGEGVTVAELKWVPGGEPWRACISGAITAPLTSRLEPVAPETHEANARLLAASWSLLAAASRLLNLDVQARACFTSSDDQRDTVDALQALAAAVDDAGGRI